MNSHSLSIIFIAEMDPKLILAFSLITNLDFHYCQVSIACTTIMFENISPVYSVQSHYNIKLSVFNA